MAKKLVTINVEDKELVTPKRVSKAKTEVQEKKEIENFGIVEINNASSTKKVKKNVERGFEKNVSGETKKTVKSRTSQVEDYFDFSFRKNEQIKTEFADKEKVVIEKKVSSNSKIEKKEEKVVNADNKADKLKELKEQVCFDSEANQIIRVARIGSLFDCDIRMMNA